MERAGITPDIITFNCLLKAAAASGLLPEARRVYAELLDAGLRPTTFTYASLFNAAARARTADADWLLEVRGGAGAERARCHPAAACLCRRHHACSAACLARSGTPHTHSLPPAIPAAHRCLMTCWLPGCRPTTSLCLPSLPPPPLCPAPTPSTTGCLPRWPCCAGAAIRGAALRMPPAAAAAAGCQSDPPLPCSAPSAAAAARPTTKSTRRC